MRAPGPPLIAVTTSEMRTSAAMTATRESDPPRPEMVLGLTYLEAVQHAGGVPVVVPPLPSEMVGAFLDRVDGLCLSGGPDIHPAAYGAEPHAALGPTEPRLDAFELELVRAADERRLPVLAICRGAQLVNVARGGALHQHLPDVVGEGVHHRQAIAASQPTHPVTVAPGSRLAGLFGRGRTDVNSFHHQAASRMGDGLVPTAWATDGTVEAFEEGGDRFLVCVQWHVECLVGRRGHGDLFTELVAAASGAAALQSAPAASARPA